MEAEKQSSKQTEAERDRWRGMESKTKSQREITDPEKEKGMDGYRVGEAETGPYAHSHRHGEGGRGRETGG